MSKLSHQSADVVKRQGQHCERSGLQTCSHVGSRAEPSRLLALPKHSLPLQVEALIGSKTLCPMLETGLQSAGSGRKPAFACPPERAVAIWASKEDPKRRIATPVGSPEAVLSTSTPWTLPHLHDKNCQICHMDPASQAAQQAEGVEGGKMGLNSCLHVANRFLVLVHAYAWSRSLTRPSDGMVNAASQPPRSAHGQQSAMDTQHAQVSRGQAQGQRSLGKVGSNSHIAGVRGQATEAHAALILGFLQRLPPLHSFQLGLYRL